MNLKSAGLALLYTIVIMVIATIIILVALWVNSIGYLWILLILIFALFLWVIIYGNMGK